VDDASESPVHRRRDGLPGMAKLARELESEAMKLSRRQRARLAQRLISSLDQEVDADAERLWFAEAERRLADLKSGKVAAIPAERVLKKVRAALR
jgi:putative addiction module component (TIGR02574 family)